MRVIAVDDEFSPLNLLKYMLDKIEGVEFIATFSNAIDALNYISHSDVDLIFVDVEMPEMNGLEFAKMLDTMDNPPQIVFITAYREYAVEAWKTSASDYLLKPFSQEDIERAIDRAQKRRIQGKKKYEFVCFPKFDLLINGSPFSFHSKRSKELMAYLIHNQGHWVDIGTLVFDLFGDSDEQASKSHYRVILSRLKQDLDSVGLDDIIVTEYGKIRADVPTECCDYYRYLRGHSSLFKGEYLTEYSWSEIEATRMRNVSKK